jgi:hypothetical protein
MKQSRVSKMKHLLRTFVKRKGGGRGVRGVAWVVGKEICPAPTINLIFKCFCY